MVTKIPKYALNVCLQQQKSSDHNEIDLGRIDPELLQTLMPFQEDGIRYHNFDLFCWCIRSLIKLF